MRVLFFLLWIDSKQRSESGNVSPDLVGEDAQRCGANGYQQVIQCNIVAALGDYVGRIQQYGLMNQINMEAGAGKILGYFVAEIHKPCKYSHTSQGSEPAADIPQSFVHRVFDGVIAGTYEFDVQIKQQHCGDGGKARPMLLDYIHDVVVGKHQISQQENDKVPTVIIVKIAMENKSKGGYRHHKQIKHPDIGFTAQLPQLVFVIEYEQKQRNCGCNDQQHLHKPQMGVLVDIIAEEIRQKPFFHKVKIVCKVIVAHYAAQISLGREQYQLGNGKRKKYLCNSAYGIVEIAFSLAAESHAHAGHKEKRTLTPGLRQKHHGVHGKKTGSGVIERQVG